MSGFVYLLRFDPAHLTQSRKPELYFVFPREEFTRFLDLLTKETIRRERYKEYLGKKMPFTTETEHFGFGGCGYVSQLGGDYEIRLPMRRKYAARICATVSFIALCGAIPIDPTVGTNTSLQQIEFSTLTEHAMHGHSIWGRVYPSFGRWLKTHAGLRDPSVIVAMQSVWREVCLSGQNQYASECDAFVGDDGRFLFQCFGNACDMAVYADFMEGDLESGHVRFHCHNLDIASQQLTLLAGLAQILTLAG